VFPCPFLTDTPLLVTEDETSSWTLQQLKMLHMSQAELWCWIKHKGTESFLKRFNF
jgi:hypothetical protein